MHASALLVRLRRAGVDDHSRSLGRQERGL